MFAFYETCHRDGSNPQICIQQVEDPGKPMSEFQHESKGLIPRRFKDVVQPAGLRLRQLMFQLQSEGRKRLISQFKEVTWEEFPVSQVFCSDQIFN